METQLKDPYSAQYILDSVNRGYCKKGWLKGKGIDWIGWFANVRINAKNSYGAYGGYEPYTVFYTGNSAVKAIEGANFGVYGPSKGALGLDGGAGVCALRKASASSLPILDRNKPRLGIGFIAVAEGAYIGAVERGNAGERAGVRVGMTISQINGQSMKNKTQDEVGQMLRQASGTIILTMSDGLQFQMEKATPE